MPIFSMVLAAFSLGLASQSFAADDCIHPFEKVFPYNLPIGNDQAYVNIHNEVQFSFDCKTALARAESEIKAGLFELNLDLLQAEAQAVAQQGVAPKANARVLVLGFEVERSEVDIGAHVDLSLSPEPELDRSGVMNVDVGPITVPIKYGVLANAELAVRGGNKGFGLVLQLLPSAAAQIYMQAGVDVSIAQLKIRGDMNLVKGMLDNNLALTFESSDHGYLRFDAKSRSELRALEGDVRVQAKAELGNTQKNYERDLLRWDGYHRDLVILDYSDKVIVLP